MQHPHKVEKIIVMRIIINEKFNYTNLENLALNNWKQGDKVEEDNEPVQDDNFEDSWEEYFKDMSIGDF
jgi:hypothetical protein